jgi:type II/III secretion system protein
MKMTMKKSILVIAVICFVFTGFTTAWGQSAVSAESVTIDEPIIRVYELQYVNAQKLSEILSQIHPEHLGSIAKVSRVKIICNHEANQLIISAPKHIMEGSITKLIEQLDVPQHQQSSGGHIQNLMYRIYMVELTPQKEMGISFNLSFRSPRKLDVKLFEIAEEFDVQLEKVVQNDSIPLNQQPVTFEVCIEGYVNTRKQLNSYIHQVGKISGQITITPEIYLVSDSDSKQDYLESIELPKGVEAALRKLMNGDMHVAGYWFGNSSLPGQTIAPLGPWQLSLDSEPNSENGFRIGIEVKEKSLKDREKGIILSNTIQGRIGKPIIVGYSRESKGNIRQGALVIVPEGDEDLREGQAFSVPPSQTNQTKNR